jgi:hypothetical protein
MKQKYELILYTYYWFDQDPLSITEIEHDSLRNF